MPPDPLSAQTERARCEGCGQFVPSANHHPSEFRWCQRCGDALPLRLFIRAWAVDRFEAERNGWPAWPMSDVARAA